MGKNISKNDKSAKKGNFYMKNLRMTSKFLYCDIFKKSMKSQKLILFSAPMR